jgi:TonB family protein
MKIPALQLKALITIVVIMLFLLSTAQAQDNVPPPPPPSGNVKMPLVIRKSGGVLNNDAIKRVEPTYPPLARAAAVSGSVVVELTVGEDGTVIGAKALSGHPLLKDSAVAAAKGWKFKPTTLSGKPVKVIGTITFNYNLDLPKEKNIEELVEEARKNPDSAEAHFDLGRAYYLSESFEKAIPELKAATRIKPDHAQAHYNLGLAYGALQRYTESADELKEAVRLDPEYVEATAALGLAYAGLREYDKAITTLKKSLELEPVAQTYYFLGMVYSATGRNEDAIASIKKGLAIWPEDVQAHYKLGQIYVEVGDKKAAMAEYAALKRLNSDMADKLLKEINQ